MSEPTQIYVKPLPNLSLTLDPQAMEDTYSFHVSSQIYDTLFKFDEFINLKPNLVESYQISDNGQVISLNLKRNIKFHNNKVLNADDIIYTIQRFIKNAHNRYPELLLVDGAQEYISGKSTSVKGINKSSSWSLEISLSAPSPTFIMLLATPSTGIMPANFNNHASSSELPIGTGPFKVISFSKGMEITLTANKDYFNGPPKLDGIIYKYATRDQAIDGFNKGMFHDLEWYNPKPEEIKVSYSVAKFPMPRTAVLLFNTRIAPFNNKEARKAFVLAINKSELMSECFSDKVEANGFIPYGLGGYDRSSKDIAFDINESKKAFELSRIKKSDPINIIWLEHHPCSGKFGKLVEKDLTSAGFKPIFKYITYSEFSNVIFKTDIRP